MADVIEGRNAVLEALRSGARLERVLLAEGLGRAPVIDEIRDLAAEAGIPVECVKRDELDRLSARGAHQGVIAVAAPFEYAELTDVLSAIATQPRALVVVLDHITDPGNLGAIIRSVEVAGGDAVVIPRDRSAAVSPVVHKASAGATAHLPVIRVPNIVQAIAMLKDADMWVVAPTNVARSICGGRLSTDGVHWWSGPRGGGCPDWSGSGATSSYRSP